MSNGAPVDTNNFSIVHYNINSITAENRLEELADVCKLLNINILILTESKLNNTFTNDLIKLPNYNEPIRSDRDRNGGGCLIYVADNLTYKHRQDLEIEAYNHLWVDVNINDKLFAINALYRPPINTAEEQNNFLIKSEIILSRLKMHNSTHKIIASDLNFGNSYCKYPILEPKPLDATAPDLFESYGMHQIIDIPTRVTADTASLIDLFFTNNIADVHIQGTLPPIADHDGIICTFNLTDQRAKPRTRTILDYKNIDMIGLTNYFKDFDFNRDVFSLPVPSQEPAFTSILVEASKKFIPSKTITSRPQDQDWSNKLTRLLLRKKNRSYQFFKKVSSKLSSEVNKQYPDDQYITILREKKEKAHKKSRLSANQSLKENRRAKNEFFQIVNQTMNNNNITAKKKFNILTKLMKTNKYTSIPPLVENGITSQDPLTKSNILNTFFASKSTVNNPEENPPLLEKLDLISTLGSVNTSSIEVSKIVRSMKRSPSSYCGIPAKFLDCISKVISKPLTTLLNNLFESSIFPENWKISHITPIYKRSGQKCEKASYRPISLLPTLSKVAESVIHQRLLTHCVENNIISERQGAYMKGDSTIHQLLYIVNHIRQTWGTGHITHGLFLDISAAFDKIWHRGLLSKLEQVGIEDKLLKLFNSYLSNRKQVVVVDGVKSETQDILAGCPQGSRLGPLLFIIYINDLSKDIESEIIIFADDTTLLASGKNTTDTIAQLSRDIIKINRWADTWKVLFNPTKTKDIIFSNKTLAPSIPLTFRNINIDRVNSHKHLGIILTSNLDWSEQVNSVCLKANRKLNILRSIKYLSRKTLDVLYKLIVRSVIDYGLPIYFNNLLQTEMRRLSQLQYRAAKLVTGAFHLTSQVKLEAELGWESISSRSDMLGAAIFHKIAINQTRPLVKSCMPKLTITQHNLRSEGKFTHFKYVNAKYSNSFFPYFTRLWNSLPKTDRQTGDMEQFKINMKLKYKPIKIKHFAKGSKYGNSLLTRLRVGRSYLNAHSYSIGLSESPACDCGAPQESSQHVLQSCPLYFSERQLLIEKVQTILPGFLRKSLKQQCDILFFGLSPENPDFLLSNTSITDQQFLIRAPRFES